MVHGHSFTGDDSMIAGRSALYIYILYNILCLSHRPRGCVVYLARHTVPTCKFSMIVRLTTPQASKVDENRRAVSVGRADPCVRAINSDISYVERHVPGKERRRMSPVTTACLECRSLNINNFSDI